MLRLNPALLKKIKDVFTDKGIGFPPGLDETDITVRSMRIFLDEIDIPDNLPDSTSAASTTSSVQASRIASIG